MADVKISALGAIASVAGEDLVAIVDDPSGTPASRKATIDQIKTFINAPELPVADTQTIVKGSADATKLLRFEVDGNTTGITGVVSTSFTTAKTLTLPDATDTLVGKATTDTLTNKTLTSPTLTSPILGTPSSGTLTSCTGLPLTTGVTGVLASANLDADTQHLSVAQTVTGKKTFGGAGAVGKLAVAGTTSGSTIIDATAAAGSGTVTLPTTGTLATLAGSETLTNKTFTAPVLGTPASGVATNITGLPLTTGVTGTLPVANGGTGVTTSTGSGANALATSPTFVTPALGTPASGVATNITGLVATTGLTATGTKDSTTFLRGDNTWSAPGGGVLELLDAHIATGTESTYTYTPGTALDVINDYSELLVIVQLEDRSTSTDLQMVLNGVTANIRQLWIRLASGTLINGWDNGANAFFEIIPTGGKGVKAVIHIGIQGTGGDLTALIDSYQDHDVLWKSSGNAFSAGATTISSIKFTLGAGTWTADSTITTYGVKRT